MLHPSAGVLARCTVPTMLGFTVVAVPSPAQATARFGYNYDVWTVSHKNPNNPAPRLLSRNLRNRGFRSPEECRTARDKAMETSEKRYQEWSRKTDSEYDSVRRSAMAWREAVRKNMASVGPCLPAELLKEPQKVDRP